MTILNAEDVKKARRKFEEELRKASKSLLDKEMFDEAEDLYFRLSQTLKRKLDDYAKNSEAEEE